MDYGIVYGVVNFKDLIEKYPVVNKDWRLNFFDIGGLSNRICNLYSYSGHNAPHEWTLDHHKYNDSVKCWFERTIIGTPRMVKDDPLNNDPWNRKIPGYNFDSFWTLPFDGAEYNSCRLETRKKNSIITLGNLYSSSVEGMKIYLLDIYEN
mgnify:FL=1